MNFVKKYTNTQPIVDGKHDGKHYEWDRIIVGIKLVSIKTVMVAEYRM